MLSKPVIQIRNSSGATMVEFTLAVFILVGAVAGILDLGRILATQALLTRAAQEGLEVAVKIQGIDESPADTASDPDALTRYINARDEVIRAALRIPNSTFISTDINGGLGAAHQLLPLSFNDAPLSGNTLGVRREAAMLLRPGEAFEYISPHNGRTNIVNHPTLCPPGMTCRCPKDPSDTDCSLPNFDPSGSYTALLIEHPLSVELRARLFLILPFFDEMEIRGRAIGFRERFADTRAPPAVAPPPVSPPAPCTIVCPEEQVLNDDLCQCEDAPPPPCTLQCGPGTIEDPDRDLCQCIPCPLTPERCNLGQQILDFDRCQCICPINASSCQVGETFSRCDCIPCPDPQCDPDIETLSADGCNCELIPCPNDRGDCPAAYWTGPPECACANPGGGEED